MGHKLFARNWRRQIMEFSSFFSGSYHIRNVNSRWMGGCGYHQFTRKKCGTKSVDLSRCHHHEFLFLLLFFIFALSYWRRRCVPLNTLSFFLLLFSYFFYINNNIAPLNKTDEEKFFSSLFEVKEKYGRWQQKENVKEVMEWFKLFCCAPFCIFVLFYLFIASLITIV